MIKDIEKYKLAGLKEVAKKIGIINISKYRKNELIEEIKKYYSQQEKDKDKEVVEGILEIIDNKDFGFLRIGLFEPSDDDVYVSPQQIRKFKLRTGDRINGIVRENKNQDKFRALIYVNTVNGKSAIQSTQRKKFSFMTPIHPFERLKLSHSQIELSTRLIDLFSPVGKGQRGLIVAPPKAGKTVLLKNIAKAIEKNSPKTRVIVLLIDERPEEVTDMKRSIKSEVISSTFDEPPQNHIKMAEMVIEKAKSFAEMGDDVVILMDSITRLARAYNLETTPSGRTLSGGLDPSALHKPKKFFGTARKLEEGGSITILATALIETGSRMDDVIFEEFKGTGNMELILSRELSERRIFPAIDIIKSGTRREDLLLEKEEIEFMFKLRRSINEKNEDYFVEEIIRNIASTKNNEDFIDWANSSLFLK